MEHNKTAHFGTQNNSALGKTQQRNLIKEPCSLQCPKSIYFAYKSKRTRTCVSLSDSRLRIKIGIWRFYLYIFGRQSRSFWKTLVRTATHTIDNFQRTWNAYSIWRPPTRKLAKTVNLVLESSQIWPLFAGALAKFTSIS